MLIAKGISFPLKLSLSQKGLLMVLVLLVFELAFVGKLVLLLKSAEEEARKEEHAKLVLSQNNHLVQLVYDAGSAIKKYVVTRDKHSLDKYDELVKEIPVVMKWLKENVPEEHVLLARMDKQTQVGLAILGRAKDVIENSAPLEAMQEFGRLQKELQLVFDSMVADFLELRRRLQEIELASPGAQRRVREQSEHLLYVGIFANILFAILLAVTFMRGITSRLAVLVDNTKRLSAGKLLHPLVGGTDEIAQLDRVFHDMADALDQAARRKKELVAMVSHDLRTPLTSLRGFLELLTMGALGDVAEGARDRARRAQNSVERLIALINDLLDLEKMESGTIQLTASRLKAETLIERAVESVSQFADEHDVTIVAPVTEASLNADGDRLVQVLVNLLSNAVKFSPPDSTVTVSVEELPGWIEFRVKDEGRGVPAAFQEAIFERFQQVEAADARAKGGTGLGLPICKAIVEQHGGTIGVDSQEGKGSEFWFRLPADTTGDGDSSP